MPCSGMLRRVAFVRIDVSEERIASIRSSETSVLTRVIPHNIPEDGILQIVRLLVFD
jgi:hypothetical protein